MVHTLAEVGAILKLSRPTVTRLIRGGRLQVVRVGRRVLVEQGAIDALLASLRDPRSRTS
jgi:excisionase family DNA binding protein